MKPPPSILPPARRGGQYHPSLFGVTHRPLPTLPPPPSPAERRMAARRAAALATEARLAGLQARLNSPVPTPVAKARPALP